MLSKWIFCYFFRFIFYEPFLDRFFSIFLFQNALTELIILKIFWLSLLSLFEYLIEIHTFAFQVTNLLLNLFLNLLIIINQILLKLVINPKKQLILDMSDKWFQPHLILDSQLDQNQDILFLQISLKLDSFWTNELIPVVAKWQNLFWHHPSPMKGIF